MKPQPSRCCSIRSRFIRCLLYALGLASLVLVLFMAQRLEARYSEHSVKATHVSPSRRASVDKPAEAIQDVEANIGPDHQTTEEKVAFQRIEMDASNRTFIEVANASAHTEPQSTASFFLDARLAGLVDDASTTFANLVPPSVKNLIPRAKKLLDSSTSVAAPSMKDENVLVVIISNRRDGIIPTLASIISTSSKPVDVVLIGEHKINNQVGAHFGKRINEFTSLSVQDITDDLVAQGLNPIWTWPDWHTSVNNPAWRNENTIHIGSWDNLNTHAHELNHIRFYLAHVSTFKNKRYFYFLDDDIMIQKDLGVLAEKTMADLTPERGLVCACNIWMWNSKCFHFEFQTKKDFILSMPSLYGDREVCKTDSEAHCVPDNYWDFVHKNMPKGGKDQHAWNFGFALFALENWRNEKLTEKYEVVMRESYRLHVFPETSLTFGLGVSYIAFAGAVECWNEEYVQVRDGFGFIEWDRYASTFGKDFFKSVDVVHYTGPDKPWVNESRIEQRAIEPWLDMMAQEKMPIPIQLPLEPTDNLFTLLASERTGAQWIMSTLDGHPQVCASGEADKPETGFPADVMLPDGLPWYPYCSIKRGCTYDFVTKGVSALTSNMTDAGIPTRCVSEYDAAADEYGDHLSRLCTFVKRLEGNLDISNIARLWVDAFISEDRAVLGCGCVRGVKAKGLKVMSEWIIPKGYPSDFSAPATINLNQTKVSGSKIIRLKRRNVWARYKSMQIAKKTNTYHPQNPGEKKSQLAAITPITIEMDSMEWNMKHFIELDRAGDEWAEEHASEVLWLDYEDCRADTADCFTKIYNFVGVDASHVTGKNKASYESAFAVFEDTDNTLDHIANKGEVMEMMGAFGWGHYISDEKYVPIQLMTYEENDILVDSRDYVGINSTIFGQAKPGEVVQSYFASALPALRSMDPNSLVVLNSDRDGKVNFHVGEDHLTFKSLDRFRAQFEELTRDFPGAVVFATGPECCASAMTHVNMGDLVDDSGKRDKRACMSGELDCQWAGDSRAAPWRDFMRDLATKRGVTSSHESVYLDTSLVGGKASDLLKFLEALDINKGEDDRAVATDYLFRNPTSIVLDYNYKIFGESRRSLGNSDHFAKYGCFADETSTIATSRLLDAMKPSEQPLFLYGRRALGCGDIDKDVPPKYPLWDAGGIVLKPILDHIDRVADAKESIVLPFYYGRKPDYRQGPEVPYIMDDKGIWASRRIRDRTNNETLFWRAAPTEKLNQVAYNMLKNEEEGGRWPALRTAVSGSGFPYFAWYGDYKTCNHRNYDEHSIPLLTPCAAASCTHAFPMPNYMTIIDTQKTNENWRGVFKEFANEYPWEKKIRKVVWRGALSEAEWRIALISVRWRLAKKVFESKSDMYDIGLTGIPSWLTEKINIDTSIVGGFVKGIAPMKNFQNYMAVLDMDGNSWSSRFGSMLCYNSVIVKVEAKYFDYFHAELKPWTHYIPVKHDLSDLDENVAWTLDPKNEVAIKGIISAANQWCSQRLIPNELAIDALDIFESYVRLLNRANPNWPTEWEQWRNEYFTSEKLNIYNLIA